MKAWMVASALLVAGAARAATPVAGDFLLVRDPSHPNGPRLVFDAVLAPLPGGDPRSDGATFEVVGDADGEGATGVAALHASGWRGLGTPPGSDGFEFSDLDAPEGVRRALLARDGQSLRLRVVAAGPRMPFRIRQPHGPIDVRFAIGTSGDDAWCARFATIARNDPARIVARNAAPPGACASRRPRCGNRVVEAAEGCDDGDADDGDGCSSACGLEAPDAACAGIARSPHDRARLVRIASGLGPVTHVTAPPLDPRRLFVVRQGGEIRILRDGVLLVDPFLSLVPGEDVSTGGERGLLSLAFHPGYAQNGRFFVFYTAPDGDLVIARYRVTADPDRADAASRAVLLRVPHPRGNHNGGQLAFGPDGYLYAGLGDGGGSNDPDETGQDPRQVLGKLLRMDVDVESEPLRRPPPDNPFGTVGRQGLIWAMGLRNPWRFSFDRLTGDLYVGDVGQSMREEIDFQPAASPGGENYGWDVFEGTRCNDPLPHFGSCPAPSPFVAPVFEYPHDAEPPAPSGCSVTGGFVYRGCTIDGMQGRYVYSDLCSRFVRSFRMAGGVAGDHQDHTAALAPVGALLGSVTTFGEDARGELHVGDASGQVFVLAPGD